MEFVRDVFIYDFYLSVQSINSKLNFFKTITVDTAFPGFLRPTPRNASIYDRYNDLIHNVQSTKLIQVGITLSDDAGNIGGTWQFNLCDFNPMYDPCNPDSIALLARSGVNFATNLAIGVPSWMFAMWMAQDIVFSSHRELKWVTFQGAYDLGYLLHLLPYRQPLPMDVEGFRDRLRQYFGSQIYDLKAVVEGNGHYGFGLERTAKLVGIKRLFGVAHQAGSDSLLTAMVFGMVRRMPQMDVERYKGCLYEMTEQSVVASKGSSSTDAEKEDDGRQ